MGDTNNKTNHHNDIILPTETIPYVQYDTGVGFGTSYLTENAAFILGGMFASDEAITINNTRYQIAPFRYNYSFATNQEITEHFEKIQRIIKPFNHNAQIIMAENIRGKPLDTGKNRMPGFSVFVPTRNNSLADIIPDLKYALSNSNKNVRRSFFAGIFDGRGSIDRNKTNSSVRYISVDCPNPDLGSFLYDVLTENNVSCNYNTARDRLAGGKPRNNQLRVKSAEQFLSEVGFISPKKNNIIANLLRKSGKKYRVYQEVKVIPELITFDIEE